MYPSAYNSPPIALFVKGNTHSMKKFISLIVLFICFLSISCRQHYEKIPNYSVITDPNLQPDQNSGVIYFFKPKEKVKVVSYYIYEESEPPFVPVEKGVVDSGTYFSLKVPVGSHTYMAHVVKKKRIKINVNPNTTYYVKCTNGERLVVRVPKLELSTKEEFESMKSDLVYFKKDK
ncbi:MAG: hypothetical protein IJS54_03785 [Desulfovibrio sp.]|nr:hypothetical protein [Desulfovibrio sp.]